MKFPSDFIALLALMQQNGIEFVLIPDYRLFRKRSSFYSGDFGLFINPTFSNTNRFIDLLHDFGFGDLSLTYRDFQDLGAIAQLFFPRLTVVIVTALQNKQWDEVRPLAVSRQYGQLDVLAVELNTRDKD